MALALRKRGKFWYARGPVPMRQADGRIKRVRIEETTREVSKTRARRVADDIEAHYREQAYRPTKASPSFTDAALTYVETKHPSKRDRGFVAKLVGYFVDTPANEIDQSAVAAAANILYPGRSPSTHVRAVWAPITTVLRIVGLRPDFKRPKVPKKKLSVPPEAWFDFILPLCPPKLAALLIFLTLRGRRITEATDLMWADVDDDGMATIGRTKTGGGVLVSIPDLSLELLGKRGTGRVFGYADRHSVKNALKRLCKRHGLPYYSSHPLGRHAFASRLLGDGKSLKFVADAGGWKSARLVIDTYGHLEKQDVDRDVKELGDRWGKQRKTLAENQGKG